MNKYLDPVTSQNRRNPDLLDLDVVCDDPSIPHDEWMMALTLVWWVGDCGWDSEEEYEGWGYAWAKIWPDLPVGV